ncbi:MAG: DUF4007 family protein [Bacteroidetes bacterium]|nr:DUF4007 family protein [Bacteroidota bacterium]
MIHSIVVGIWLKKGYEFIKKERFGNSDAFVFWGGKNMVSSIRYWMKAF